MYSAGQKVLEVTTKSAGSSAADPDLHMFAHCGRETDTVVFSFANRSPTRSISVALQTGTLATALAVNVAEVAVATEATMATVATAAAGAVEAGTNEGDSDRTVGTEHAKSTTKAGQAKLVTRDEYILTSSNHSSVFGRGPALLNGRPLVLAGYAKLPSLAPATRDNANPLVILPFSVGFVVLHGAPTSFCT
jgi:hypothetical protein